jgi:hypothetical protein
VSHRERIELALEYGLGVGEPPHTPLQVSTLEHAGVAAVFVFTCKSLGWVG